MALTPFTFNKIVLVGASITNQSFNYGTIRVIENYILKKYGIAVTIIDEAVSGSNIATIRANIDNILSSYTGETQTLFVMHALGNDVGNGQFLDQGEGKQQQLREDLEYVYDAVQGAGHTLIQSALTFRNYNGTTIDEGSTITNELEGSYTFNRDLIVPVMQSKAPEFLYDRDGQLWPMIDAYNASRNVYKSWRDPENLTDYVHPSKWARMIHALTLIEGATEISQGVEPPVIPRRDFTTTPGDGTEIDFILRFNKKSAEGATTANINSTADAIDNSYDGPFTFENLIDTDGNSVSNVNAYTYINFSDDDSAGNSADPSNDETTLSNNLILSSAAGVNDGANALYVVVDGLEANKTYEISYVAAANPSGSDCSAYYWPHDGIESQNQALFNPAVSDPENYIFTTDAVSDSSGKLVFSVEEQSTNNRAVLSGLRISSEGSAQVNQPPTANAGANLTATNGDTVTLTGATASDYDSLSWTCTSGQSPTITNGNTLTPTITFNEVGVHTLRLTATNAEGSDFDALDVDVLAVQNTNQPPVANAGPDQSIAAGATCILEGSASSDGDGTIVSYEWTKVSGPTIALANADQAVASFIAPSESTIQTLVFELIVTDDDGATSAPDTVTVTVAAVPDVADPLDPTLSVFNIKSKVGIEDDNQSFGVASLYQYTDNFILCEVLSKAGAALTPDAFSQAEYRIVDNKGANVVKLALGTGIKEADGKFLIHINSGILNKTHKGSLKHQFVVWNQAGHKLPPIFGGTVNVIPVLEPTL